MTVYYASAGWVGIENPTMQEVVSGLKNIDAGKVAEFKLFKKYEPGLSGKYLRILGEIGLYHISEWQYGDEFHTFRNPEIDEKEKVNLQGWKIPFQLKQFCMDRELTIEIAQEYFLYGTLSKKTEWW